MPTSLYLFYKVATHPTVEKKLVQEIREAFLTKALSQ